MVAIISMQRDKINDAENKTGIRSVLTGIGIGAGSILVIECAVIVFSWLKAPK